MDDLPPFGFRIRFLIPENQIIDHEGESFDTEFPDEGITFRLTSASEKLITNPTTL